MPEPRTQESRMRRAALAVGAAAMIAGGAVLFGEWQGLAQMMGHMHGGMHGGMHGHGADGMGHDEATMPGLRGLNATPDESAELATLFRNFQTLSRDVTNLPDGIRTVTRSSDPAVMDALISHTTGMIARVERGDDPQIMIQSPTLDIFFQRGAGISSPSSTKSAWI